VSADVGHLLVLVRHGETEWSRTGRHTGTTDVELTDLGRREAVAQGQLLGRRHFAAAFASPMHRSLETASLAGCPGAAVLEDLREWNYGAYEGRTTAAIREEVPHWTVWTHRCPGGETAEQVATRVDRVIARARSIEGDVVCFGHGHSLRVLGARWCGLAPQTGRVLALDPAAICVLGYERETPVIRLWNRTPDVA
jgi:probable phosphoglycerate mutase